LSSRRSDFKPNPSHLEKTGRLPEKEKGIKVADSFLNTKRGADRAKQLFDDLESELLDLDAGRHVVVRGKRVSTKKASTKKSQANITSLSPEEVGTQILDSKQALQLSLPFSKETSVGAGASEIYQTIESKFADIISAYHQVRIWLVNNPNRWLAPVIIIGVLELSIILAYKGSMRQLEYVLLMVCGIGAVVVFMRWPTLGIILTLLGGIFVPFSGPSGINVTVFGVLVLLGLWFLDMFVRKRQIHLVPSRTVLPVLIFIILSVLSFFMGQLPFFTFFSPAPLDAQLGGLAIFVLSAGAFIIVAHQVNDLCWLQRLTWVFIAFGAFYMLGRSIEWGGIDRLYQNGFVAGSMFWTWLTAMTFSQVVFNLKLKPAWRFMLVGIFVITLYVAFFQQYDWKSGWLPPLAAVATIFVLRYRKVALAAIPIGVIAAVIMVVRAIATEQWSWSTRLEAWRIVLEISKASPIFGLGFGNYHFYVKLIPLMGWYSTFNSHNQYVDLIAQTGVLGLVCFLWFIVETGALGWRLRRQVPEGFATAYVYGALGGLVGTLIAAGLVDWVLPFAYNIGLTGFRASVLAWFFMGGLVSLEQIYRQQMQISTDQKTVERSWG